MTISKHAKKFAAIIPAIALAAGLAATPAQAAPVSSDQTAASVSSTGGIQLQGKRIIWVC